MNRVGDWYLALDGRSPSRGRFNGIWQRVFEQNDKALFVQPVTDSWVGWSWLTHADDRGVWWLQGAEADDVDMVGDVAWGGKDPVCLGGSYALVHLGVDGRLGVVTDRMGTQHVYRSPSGIGSNMAAVATGSRKDLDWRALTGFFTCGFFPSETTFYEDVQIFTPARRFRLSHSGTWAGERYWNWAYRPEGRPSYEDAVDELVILCRQAMDRLSEKWERLAVPLSGGLDSRLTLAALSTSRTTPWLYSYGYGKRSVETNIARRLAGCRSMPVSTFEIGSYLPERADEVSAALEGFQDITQTRQAFLAPDLRENADGVVAAHWGDVWLDDMGLTHRSGTISDAETAEHTLQRLRKRGHRWLIEHLCREHLSEDPDELLRDWATAELGAYDLIGDPDFKVKAFKTDQWSFRWTLASLRAYQLGASPLPLFYHPSFVDFFLEVPTQFVAGRRMEIDAIKRLAPDLARVPWQVYDASLYSWQYFNTWLLPKRAVKKAWRILTRQRVIERNWEVQFLNPAGKAFVEDRLVGRGLRLHELVSPLSVRGLLDRFWDGRSPADGYTVSMLLTFSLWLESQ